MGGACQREVIRHRVRSKLLRYDGQLGMLHQLVIILGGLRRLDASPGDWPGRLRRRIWNIGGRASSDPDYQLSPTQLVRRSEIRRRDCHQALWRQSPSKQPALHFTSTLIEPHHDIYHHKFNFFTSSLVRAGWQHRRASAPMVGVTAALPSTLNRMLTSVPQDSGPKCSAKRSV